MELNKIFIFLIILGILSIGTITAQLQTGLKGDMGINIIQTVATNYSYVNTNSSNFWDLLDTPANIQHNDLGGLQGGIAGQFYHLALNVYNWLVGNYNNFWMKNETITGNISGNLSGSYGYSLQDAYDGGNLINLLNNEYFGIFWKPIGAIDFVPGVLINNSDKSIDLTAKHIIINPFTTTASNFYDIILDNPGPPYTSSFRILRDSVNVFMVETGTGTISDIRSVGWTPLDDAIYDLGDTNSRWRNLYLSGNITGQTLNGTQTFKIEAKTTGNIETIGNITLNNSKLCLTTNCSKYIWYNGSNVVIKG